MVPFESKWSCDTQQLEIVVCKPKIAIRSRSLELNAGPISKRVVHSPYFLEIKVALIVKGYINLLTLTAQYEDLYLGKDAL